MSWYQSIQTGHAPGGFHLKHPDRWFDVAYSAIDKDVRLIVQTSGVRKECRLNQLEARDFATRLLIALGEDQDIIDRLLAKQEEAGAGRENHW